MRETELRILQTLRMDYETFINASFFLQGKADQFTQQRPGDRKRILGSILGLEVWESYRQRAAERRKLVESDITGLDGRLKEISAELAEEQARRNRLQELETDLKRLEEQRHSLDAAVADCAPDRRHAARAGSHGGSAAAPAGGAPAASRREYQALERAADGEGNLYRHIAARQPDRSCLPCLAGQKSRSWSRSKRLPPGSARPRSGARRHAWRSRPPERAWNRSC